MISMKPMRFFSSWSGGKDSCLALYRSIKSGHECASLFTMIDENGRFSRSHGLTSDTLEKQAQALGIPLCTVCASWGEYEGLYLEQAAKYRGNGVLHGVFGDIDLEVHREWVVRVCGNAGVTAHLPLWKENRRSLVDEFINAGFRAMIVMVNTSKMPDKYLGRVLDCDLADELENIGVDACGENGEFHTFVFDGPIFKTPLDVKYSLPIYKEKYAGLPLEVEIIAG